MDIFARIIICLVIAVIVIGGILGIVNWNEECEAKEQIRDAQKAAYNARLPKAGDRIDVNGTEVVIMKRYVWAYGKFKVRLPDGRMTDILASELLDKKPIGAEEDG